MGSCVGTPKSPRRVRVNSQQVNALFEEPGAGYGQRWQGEGSSTTGTAFRGGDMLGVALPQRLWQSDEEASHCSRCGEDFTMIRRRHHCRACGRLRCGRCSRKKTPLLPDIGPARMMRVCDDCFDRLPAHPGDIAASYSGSGTPRSLGSSRRLYGGQRPSVVPDSMQGALGGDSPPARFPKAPSNSGLSEVPSADAGAMWSACDKPYLECPRREWEDGAKHCGGCGKGFGLLAWRHHCRVCGLTRCGQCSRRKLPLMPA
eukprot:Hpha_TRINITY_DN17589_c0_g1::TRINITY_DN17589_c0_g1_i1::g.92551::m.92551